MTPGKKQLPEWILTQIYVTKMTSLGCNKRIHYSDVIMSAMVSLIIGFSIVYWTVCLRADQRIHQSSVLLAFVRGIHRWPVNSLHKGPVKRKMVTFYDVIMYLALYVTHSIDLIDSFPSSVCHRNIAQHLMATNAAWSVACHINADSKLALYMAIGMVYGTL